MSESEEGKVQWATPEGWVCLEFANTVGWHASEHPEEGLKDYSDLVTWAAKVGLLSQAEAQQSLRLAAASPSEAEAALREARDLRELVYRVFVAVAHKEPVSDQDLSVLHGWLSRFLPRLRVVRAPEGYEWMWASDGSLDGLLAPVAHSAAQLLTSDVRDRVGQCADDRGCGWLFFDTSKNHSRRWCDIKDCGNRAKLKRFYARHKGAGAQPRT